MLEGTHVTRSIVDEIVVTRTFSGESEIPNKIP